jgi:hypothetical protein
MVTGRYESARREEWEGTLNDTENGPLEGEDGIAVAFIYYQDSAVTEPRVEPSLLHSRRSIVSTTPTIGRLDVIHIPISSHSHLFSAPLLSSKLFPPIKV